MKSRKLNLNDKIGLLKRLLENTIINETDCFIWTGAISNGYGVLRLKKWGPKYYTHRLSAYIYLNLDIDSKNAWALHKDKLCSNRSCWNPAHLYVGNYLNNIQDSIKKGTHFKVQKW